MQFDAVIPAGGALDGEYRVRAGTTLRAMSPIGESGRPVLQFVVDALRNSGQVGRIIVVGDESLTSHVGNVDVCLPEAGSGPANILRGLAELPPERMAVVCTSDLPFLTGRAVADFLERVDTNASIAVGLVPASRYMDQYPNSPPSQFVTLRETGPVTMGCLFMVVPDVLIRNAALLDRAFLARKSQWPKAHMAVRQTTAGAWRCARTHRTTPAMPSRRAARSHAGACIRYRHSG